PDYKREFVIKAHVGWDRSGNTKYEARHEEAVAFEISKFGLVRVGFICVSADFKAFINAACYITEIRVTADFEAVRFEQTFRAGELSILALRFNQLINR